MTVKPVDLRGYLGINHSIAGGEGVVTEASTDSKGEIYNVLLNRKGINRRTITRVVRRPHLIVHRERKRRKK